MILKNENGCLNSLHWRVNIQIIGGQKIRVHLRRWDELSRQHDEFHFKKINVWSSSMPIIGCLCLLTSFVVQWNSSFFSLIFACFFFCPIYSQISVEVDAIESQLGREGQHEHSQVQATEELDQGDGQKRAQCPSMCARQPNRSPRRQISTAILRLAAIDLTAFR